MAKHSSDTLPDTVSTAPTFYTIVTVWDGPVRRTIHAYDIYHSKPDAEREARKMRKDEANTNVTIKVIKILQAGKDYDE